MDTSLRSPQIAPENVHLYATKCEYWDSGGGAHRRNQKNNVQNCIIIRALLEHSLHPEPLKDDCGI